MSTALRDFRALPGAAAGALDEAPDFDAYCRTRTFAVARVMLLLGAALMVSLIPVDFLVYSGSAPNRVVSLAGRVSFLLVSAGLYTATLTAPARAFLPAVVGGLTVLGTVVFYVLGAAADAGAPFIYNVFFLAFIPVPFLLPLRARLAALVLPCTAAVLAYYLPHPQQWGDRYLAMVLLYVAGGIFLSAVIGHLLYRLEAASFSQRRVIRGNVRELAATTLLLNEALEADRQAYAREKALREAIPDTLVRLDRSGRVRAVHKPRSETAPGGLPQSAGGGEEAAAAPRLREAIAEALKTGTVQSIQYSVDTPEGEHHFETRVCRVSDDELVAVRRDITPMHRMLGQLHASERLSALGRLSAGVAHEVNNPLTYVLLNIDLARKRVDGPRAGVGPEDADRTASLLRALDNARRGALRVRDIVAALKMYSRQSNDELHAVDVGPAVQASVEMTRNLVETRARLEVDLGSAPPVLATDARLTQVLVNLLTNAAQAVPPGDPDAHFVRVVTRESGGRAVIEVTDSGQGMSEEVQRRIFDPFFTTKPQGEGTGLGLAISLGIIQDFRGTIEVLSTPGKGATFRVLLPAAQSSALAVPEAAPAPLVETPRRRVLIVDDEPQVAQALALSLEGVHDVACATTGQEAIERLTSGGTYDAVLCDLQMPGASGVDVFETVTAQHPALARRFIFMTGGAFTERTRAFRERVPNVVLDKPLDVESVCSRIEAVLR